MKKFLLLLLIIPLCSCATTRTVGYLYPDYKNNYKINKIVVSFKGADPDETLELEEQMIQKLSAYNVKVIKYREVLSPTKNYTDNERLNKIRESGGDTLLFMEVSKRTSRAYIPPTYVKAADGISTYAIGGVDMIVVVITTLSSLIDVENGNTIWKAETVNAYADENTSYFELFELAFDGIIADMNDRGLLKSNNIETKSSTE